MKQTSGLSTYTRGMEVIVLNLYLEVESMVAFVIFSHLPITASL
jgi:hypothetical protein